MFTSFFMGGFECADHINRSGERINLLKETAHDARSFEDYQLLKENGIATVREGICWSAVETVPFQYDFTEVAARMQHADICGIQVIWDLCHFGYPDGLIPTHPHFTARFTSLCTAFAQFYKTCTSQQLLVVPINEISFLSWHSGDVRGTVPFGSNCGFDIKYHLCKAAIAGIKALKTADPDCLVILVEPLVKVHPRLVQPDFHHATRMTEDQFQAMDIIAGYMCPELGGSPDLLEVLGFNYYYNNEWYTDGTPLGWPVQDNRRSGLYWLLKMAYDRYKKPIILSETGHFGDGRSQWLIEVAEECELALKRGVELKGVCIYPVIDRPDWDDLGSYSNCGFWDLDSQKNRVPKAEYLTTFRQISEQFQRMGSPAMLQTAGTS